MFILIAAAAAASACAAAPASSAGAAMLCVADAATVQPVLGGWRAVATDDAGVQAAATFAAGELGSELSEVTEASSQVVAGLNFRIKLSLSDGRTFNVVVFRALNGSYSLTSSEEVETDTGSNESSQS